MTSSWSGSRPPGGDVRGGERARHQVAARKDLDALQAKLKTRARDVARAESPSSELERAGLTAWDFDTLPKTIDTRQGGNTVRAYPALVDGARPSPSS